MSGIYGATVMYNKASGQSTPLLLEKEGYETIFDKTVQTIFTIDETYIASYNPISATIISRKSGQKIPKIANLQYYKSKANYGTKKKGISR